MEYLAIFIGSGWLGWLIDSSFRSWKEKRLTSGTLLPYFSLAYATASLALYHLFNVWSASFFSHILVGTLLCIAVEFVGGKMAWQVLRRRLWDYRKNRWNYLGFIDA